MCQLYGGEETWYDGGDFKCENRAVCSVEMAPEGFDCVSDEAEACGENECLCQQYEEGEIWCKDEAMCKDEGFACKKGPDAGNSPSNLILLIFNCLLRLCELIFSFLFQLLKSLKKGVQKKINVPVQVLAKMLTLNGNA